MTIIEKIILIFITLCLCSTPFFIFKAEQNRRKAVEDINKIFIDSYTNLNEAQVNLNEALDNIDAVDGIDQ